MEQPQWINDSEESIAVAEMARAEGRESFSGHPEAMIWALGGVWDWSAPVFPALLQLHGAKHI
jgi:hypothetical protein